MVFLLVSIRVFVSGLGTGARSRPVHGLWGFSGGRGLAAGGLVLRGRGLAAGGLAVGGLAALLRVSTAAAATAATAAVTTTTAAVARRRGGGKPLTFGSTLGTLAIPVGEGL